MNKEIETLMEMEEGNLFVEVVRGLNGIYFALSKRERGLCLTLKEAIKLSKLIRNATEYQEDTPVWENFDNEPE